MGEETERLDRLVANLLDLSRLEAGALVAHLDWCAPAEMVAGAIDAAAPVPRRRRRCGPTSRPDLPLVRADAVLCERILVNLLHNAVRHGAPPIAVEGRVAGGRLEIAVDRRRGRASTPPLADRVFDPFVVGRRAAAAPASASPSRAAWPRRRAPRCGPSRRPPGPASSLAFALTTVPQVA